MVPIVFDYSWFLSGMLDKFHNDGTSDFYGFWPDLEDRNNLKRHTFYGFINIKIDFSLFHISHQ